MAIAKLFLLGQDIDVTSLAKSYNDKSSGIFTYLSLL